MESTKSVAVIGTEDSGSGGTFGTGDDIDDCVHHFPISDLNLLIFHSH